MTTYVLPDLTFDYSALEPHISARVMELHHSKHHAKYVEGANNALEQLDEARQNGDLTKLSALEKSLAFNLSGHVLHSLFWCNLTPGGRDRPAGELARAIERDLGGFDAMKKQINAAAASIMGSGWAALVWEPLGRRLLTSQIYDHQSNINQGGVPLLVLDAWEHAYYLQYENRKQEFFEAVWSCWNWDDVADRFQEARKLELDIPGAVKENGRGAVPAAH